jgi:hypothetical protein
MPFDTFRWKNKEHAKQRAALHATSCS